jgi:protein Mpv17
MLAAWGNLPPLPRAALTSCALMAVGDGVCQCIQANRRQQQQDQKQHTPLRLDLGRTAKFGVIGLTLHGPFFFK